MSTRLKTTFIPFWKDAPLTRFLLPLMVGIILQWYVPLSIIILGISTLLVLLILIVCVLTVYKSRFHLGLVVYCLLMLAGCWLVYIKNPFQKIGDTAKQIKTASAFIATIDEPIVVKEKSFKAMAVVQMADSNHHLINLPGKTIIYFTKDSLSSTIKYGDQVLFRKPLNEIENSGNPGAFDYRRYAAFNDLYFRISLKENNYKKLHTTYKKAFYKTLYDVRDFVIDQFKKYIPDSKEAGLAEALLIGYKDDLDKDLVEDYANTGVVHIIAISGMHLGLIYGLLLLLFKPFNKRRHGKLISGILMISALWLFSILTGASPSITRSALMFTAIIIGNSSNRQISIYNSLAVSAFALLIINPFNLWDVGFQLSYAAVFSIALLGKPVTNWFSFNNTWLQKTWELVAVTIAAQIFTLPFVIYHFHQFPLLFIFSNLLAVPLSGLILYGLILLLPLSFVPWLAKYVGLGITVLIKGLNGYISFIATLSFSRVDSMYLDTIQATLLMIVIASICNWLLSRSSKALLFSLAFSLLFIIDFNFSYARSLNQNKLVVYSIPGKTAIDIINGRRFHFIGDTVLAKKSFLQNFHLLPARILYRVSLADNLPLAANGFARIEFGAKSMIILLKPAYFKTGFTIKADYLLVGKDCKSSPFQLLKNIQIRTVILDASLPLRYQTQWQIAADSLHLRLHSIKQGAFQADL